ncbi:hypothetical protein J3U21_04655 [Gilliamella sp. B2776]|uniref:hypothetical protein n=1 Tax=unclassified Gilliamella TaxID=2685620 RepID=UPI00226AD312|nr:MULTISPECIES: hypothetical protein [unclassified Gilliamella]MCX8578693.1 hypothetical protein [Gilliamella sp. B2717]MCX8649575.1 hypothetical protein [Gilliamella sp. B2779]MCX8654907.1 hypothetical protein [Gilliamella sp. B2737]MCX8691435.1 hypothetical protein [Gilliamella sp. B2776]MCX8702504.1 hypothetical protein [Gilliamella sp. B2781]
MKNKDKSIQSDTSHKMLFNSDGFEIFIKCITLLFTFVGALLFFVVKLFDMWCETSTKEEKNKDEIAYFDDDGHAYTKDGEIKW